MRKRDAKRPAQVPKPEPPKPTKEDKLFKFPREHHFKICGWCGREVRANNWRYHWEKKHKVHKPSLMAEFDHIRPLYMPYWVDQRKITPYGWPEVHFIEQSLGYRMTNGFQITT